MYKLNSLKAEEFIDHQEVLDTLEYARTHKSNRALSNSSSRKLPGVKDSPIAKQPCCWNATSQIW